MVIAIKSEVDSRVILYPLLRALWNHGSICVITSNKQVARLVDEDTGTFRDVTIYVDTSGATDDVMDEYDITEDSYQFIVLDNMGMSEFDKCLVPVGMAQSETFDTELQEMLCSEEYAKIHIIQYGTPSRDSKTLEAKKVRDKELTKASEEYNPADKFKDVDEERAKIVNKVYKTKFPTYEEIERVEALHVLPIIDPQMVPAFHEILKDVLGVDSNQFRKEVSKKDEYCSNLKSRDTSGLK